MLNKVILQGNIGRAPKISLTQEGREIASFSLATSTYWKDKSGEWQSRTDWHGIVVFRKSTISWIKDILKRGDSVYVEGKLTYQQKTDGYGQTRFVAHVVVSEYDGKVQHLKSSRLNPQNNELIPETEQKSSSLLNEKEGVSSSLDIPLKDLFSTQPCPQTSPREEEDLENFYHNGETTHENQTNSF
ncbi:MAG: hypothetical protein BGO67_03885 [Alphaproteobacteria bacterium 41-28]|nr:MAG: hypothetical protein BGO67_03885 [Alphaproteobacteria bacterium 41-28]